MARIINTLLGCLIALYLAVPVLAQEEGAEDDAPADDFDFGSLVPAKQVKAFCSSRILGGGPQQLV